MNSARVRSLGLSVPERVVTNDDMARIVDTSDEWIFSHTGIRKRHHAGPAEGTSDLGAEAAQRALRAAGVQPEDVDLVIVATSSSDYPNFPSTACIIQERLGLGNAAAFDLAAGCTGFVYGLETARAFVESGIYRVVLLIGAEILSKIADMTDRNSCVLFGDGAGAVVMTAPDYRGTLQAESDRDSFGFAAGPRISVSWLRSQGSGEQALIRRAGGTRNPFQPGVTDPRDLLIAMNGREVYMFAVDAIVRTIQQLLDKSALTIDDVRWIVPHQANVRIIEAAAKRLRIPIERFFTNIDEYANTSAASIPLAWADMLRAEVLQPGDTIITVGFGAGLTYGGNVIHW